MIIITECDVDNEIWKDIQGFEGVYQVSNLGRVRSLPRTVLDRNNHEKQLKGHYMTGSDNGNGYLSVMFRKNNKCIRRYIHRLVAQAFLPNPMNLPEVNHKDENRSNNIVNNLEWTSYIENRLYGTRIKRLSKSNTRHAPIIQYDFDFNPIAKYDNAIQAGRALGINGNMIYKIANKQANTIGGFIWRYEDDTDIYCIPKPGKLFMDIYQYDATTGEFIKHYYNSKTASEEMEITPIMLRKYIDQNKSIHNYFWCSKLLTEEERNIKINAIQNLPVQGVKKDGNRWYSEIKYNKKHFKLGSYIDKNDAIKARLQKEIELYGTFNAPQSYLFNQYLNINP